MFDATQMILRLEDWCYRETFWPRLLQDGVLFEGLHVLIGQRQVPPNLLDWVKDSQREFPQDSKRYQVARALICCAHLAEQLAKTVQNQAIPFGEVDEALIALKDMPELRSSGEWRRGVILTRKTADQVGAKISISGTEIADKKNKLDQEVRIEVDEE